MIAPMTPAPTTTPATIPPIAPGDIDSDSEPEPEPDPSSSGVGVGVVEVVADGVGVSVLVLVLVLVLVEEVDELAASSITSYERSGTDEFPSFRFVAYPFAPPEQSVDEYR